MKPSQTFAMLLVALGAFATASTVADAMVFDLSHDFSVETNPTVTWTYEYKTNLAGPVVPFATHKVSPDDHGLMIASWSKNGLDPSDIIFNQTTSIAISDGGAGVFEPGTVIVHAGLDGNLDNFGAVRFTVPAGASGIYDVANRVRTYLDGAKSHDADYHVIYNGLEIYGVFMDPNTSAGTTNILRLVEGDTLDFLVGRGADGTLYGSGLKVEARLERIRELPPRFDLSHDFSATNNPAGVWSYGYEDVAGTNFTAFTVHGTSPDENGFMMDSWSKTGLDPADVFFNPTDSIAYSDGGTGVFPPKSVWFHAGYDGAPDFYGAIRFKVPVGEGGAYWLDSHARTCLTAYDADFHVSHNGVEIYGSYLDRGAATGFGQVVTLAEGDTVDFLAGRGADGTLYGSGLTLQAMLTPLAADGAVTVFPSGGYFTNDVQITMVCSVTNAVIHYSLDASKPTAHSPIWTGGLVLTNSAVIQAQAFLGDLPISESVVTTFLRVYAFDNDGIAADWRLRFFGPGYATNPLAVAAADPDGDGADNLKEYQAGSNPLDSSSVPLLLAVRLAPIISWDSISNVVYRVQRRILSETNWVDLAPDVVATGNMSSYVDRDAVKSALYRVIIP